MTASRTAGTLLTIAAVLVLGSAFLRPAGHGSFGVITSVGLGQLEVRVRVSTLCLRLVAELPGRIAASADLAACRSCNRQRREQWI